MKRIVYLMSGPAHLPYLTVSLFTLRQVDLMVPVEVFAWPESFEIVEQISQDERLNISCSKREPALRGRNSQFLDKIDLVRGLPKEDIVLYLDADTTIHNGRFHLLFGLADYYGFAATQFNNWTSNVGSPKRRIGWLRKFDHIDHRLIDRLQTECWPSVNGGVWAAGPSSPVLQTWYDWTLVAKEGAFIADECVLHLLQGVYGPQGRMVTACDSGMFNSSPKYQACSDPDVVIQHYHGDSNVRPQKSQKGYDLWWPLYQRCLLLNVGGMRDWRSGVKNKWMDRLEAE